jgi:hypothetical protein
MSSKRLASSNMNMNTKNQIVVVLLCVIGFLFAIHVYYDTDSE